MHNARHMAMAVEFNAYDLRVAGRGVLGDTATDQGAPRPGERRRHQTFLFLLSCFLHAGVAQAGDLTISEFMAANTRTVTDEDGEFSDWIEIHNAGASVLNLNGWFLTDSPSLTPRWQFPETNIAARGYLVLFASGKDRRAPGEWLHTSFRLDAAGGYLALLRPDGQIEYEVTPGYPKQHEDISFGLQSAVDTTLLIGPGKAAQTLVPDATAWGAYGTNWWGGNEAAFESAGGTNGWRIGALPVGFGEALGGLGQYRRAITGEVSLLSYYTFEDVMSGAGGVPDVAPTSPRSGTLVGIATTAANGVGGGGSRALLLPGGSPGYVALGRAPEFDFTDNTGTIELWIQPAWVAGSAGTNPSFFANRDAGGTRYSFHLRDGHALVDIYTGVVNAFGYSYDVPNPRAWHHVAVVIAAGTATFYVDGQSRGAMSLSMGSTARTVQIGHTLAGTEFWRGGIDEVALYSNALSASAIQAHFRAMGAVTGTATLGTDLAVDMPAINASAWTRIPFTVTDRAAFNSLTLRMQCDDGFVAYLNGVKVAEANAPALLDNQASATGASNALSVQQFDLTHELRPGGALRSGANVLAIHGLNVSADDPDFFISPTLTGEKALPAVARYFLVPTPGASNTNGLIGLVADTRFSADRGFYDQPLSVEITTTTEGAEIWCTLDGTPPAPLNAQAFRYTNAIPIAGTTTLSAAAFKEAWRPSDVDTHTYVFVDDVVTQPEMDRRVVTNAAYASTIRTALKSLPTVSLSLDPADLNSIYSNPGGTGTNWERRASMEFFDPNTGQEFQVPCGLRIHGADSRNHVKKPFGLFFRASYGAAKLEYPLFAESPVTQFDKLVLRSGGHDAWTSPHSAPAFSQATSATYIRDEFQRLAQIGMGHPSARGRFVHLYLNGRYWGLYNLIERVDEDFVSGHLGGRDEDWDVLQGPDSGEFIVWGTNTAWNAMQTIAGMGLSTSNAYWQIQGYLELDNFIDYMINGIWGGNTDWLMSSLEPQTGSRNKNWFAARNRMGGTFRFFVHDAEISMAKDHQINRRVNVNITDVDIPNSPGRLYARLRQNVEFRLRFADRLQKHLFENGALAPFRSIRQWQQLIDEIQSAMVPESARWGDAISSSVLFTRDNQWRSEVDWIKNTFFLQRHPIVLQQFRVIGLFPSNSPPTLNQFGGSVASGFELMLTPTGAGEVYYTLDGSDPRLPGGALSTSAVRYTGESIPIRANVTFRARTLTAGIWSALVETPFRVIATDNVVMISEIMFHPLSVGGVDGGEFEFLELKNAGTTPLDMTGLFFSSGINFAFTNNTVLAPGQFFVLARNGQQFTNQHPGVAVNGIFTGRLADEGETLTLTDPLGRNLVRFAYGTRPRWPIAPDGFGFSLVPVHPNETFDPDEGQLWRASSSLGGSPGSDDPPAEIPPIVVNEVLSASNATGVDYIELFNPTDHDVSIGGWFLTDEARAPKKFRIPDSIQLSPGGFALFAEPAFNTPLGAPIRFALDSSGDGVFLFSADANANLTGYSHGFSFAAAERDVSFGRHVNSVGIELFPAQLALSPNAINTGPRVPPVVINEILYHARAGQDEFIELKNLTGTDVPLYDPAHPSNTWRVGGVSFTFPPGVNVPANGFLLLVSTNADAFRARYQVPLNVPVLAYSGALQDSGENLELQAPAPPDTNGLAYVLIDAVRYNDKPPWPVAADGSGASLARKNAAAYGNGPASWTATAPSPGAPYPGGAAPIITTQPQPGAVLTGGNATLSVSVTGAGPLGYQWRFQADPIPNATNVTLLLTNAQLAQAGDYSVVVFNAAGSAASLPARLTVHQPALIALQPSNQFVRAGANATFTVFAAGTDTLRYQWYRNGLALAGRTGTTLALTNVQSEQEGAYTVSVSDRFTNILSAPVRLILLINPAIVEAPLSQSVVAGGAVTLSVRVSGQPEPFGYIWRRGLLALGTFVLNSSNCFLTLTNLQPAQGGAANIYRVYVTNAALPGLVTNATFFLDVLTDTDGDRLPDVWEAQFGFATNLANATVDADGDGMSNAQEYAAGTDPTNALSYLKIDRVDRGSAAVEFYAMSNRTYSVQFREPWGVGAWTRLADVVARSTNRIEVVPDLGAPTNRFYRLVTPRQP